MIYAISYSNEKYNNPKRWNLQSALEHGVDKVISYSPSDIDAKFFAENRHILNSSRGAGYWLWKPYIILKTMKQINYGDFLVYADAGSAYVNDVSILIDQMQVNEDYVMVFDQPYIEREWTKRDAFILMECDEPKYSESHQIMATYLVIKKTKDAEFFVEEWLRYCCDQRIISDDENVMGLDNYCGFVENRHDQTVLSLLAKKHKLRVYEDPSCLIVGCVEEQIKLNNKVWISHKTPFVKNLNELLRVNRMFYDQYWSQQKKTIIYGAGVRGKQLYSYAKKMSQKIDAFVVTSEKLIKEKYIDDVPVYSMEIFPWKISDCKFVVTILNEVTEIDQYLESLGAEYINYKEYNRDIAISRCNY